MLKINEKFKDAALEILIQPLPYSRVLETRDSAKKNLTNFLINFQKIFPDFDFEIGKNKNLGTAERKALRDYDGEKRCVTDYVRAKASVASPETVTAIRSRSFEHLLYEHGIEIAGENDLFEEPKDQTGYRCINLKLAIPVNMEQTEHHIVELQIVAEQIEAVYDETHEYKRRAEEADDKVYRLEKEKDFEGVRIIDLKERAFEGERLTPEQEYALTLFDEEIKSLKRISKLNYAACRLINGRAARGLGNDHNFEELLSDDPKIRNKFLLSPGKEEHMDSMKFQADVLAKQDLD